MRRQVMLPPGTAVHTAYVRSAQMLVVATWAAAVNLIDDLLVPPAIRDC